MKLETIGKILASGFGDRVAVGIMIGALEEVIPDQIYEYIKGNTELLHWLSDSDWQKYRQIAKDANIGDITREMIISELRKYKPDILSILINDPRGLDWLDNQIAKIKHKLEID